jgi:hypothetical protein
MGETPAFEQQTRMYALQSAVFRCLRARGLDPQVSDTLGRRVSPAATFAEQLSRTSLAVDVVAELHRDLGLCLGHDERRWVGRVIDAACERLERWQRRQQLPAVRPMVATSTTTATAVVFRRRTGGSHG